MYFLLLLHKETFNQYLIHTKKNRIAHRTEKVSTYKYSRIPAQNSSSTNVKVMYAITRRVKTNVETSYKSFVFGLPVK